MNVVNAGTMSTSGSTIGYCQNSGTVPSSPSTVRSNTITFTPWGFWQDYYYPQVIRESYPVYIRERAEDKGKHAFEIIKSLQDKKLLKLEKVSDFIEAMDTLIKIL